MTYARTFSDRRGAMLLAGLLLLAAAELGQPTQAFNPQPEPPDQIPGLPNMNPDPTANSAAVDEIMGALPRSTLPSPGHPSTNQAGPQPEPPTTPTLGANPGGEPTAALLLPAVQAAREAARRTPTAQVQLPAVMTPQIQLPAVQTPTPSPGAGMKKNTLPALN